AAVETVGGEFEIFRNERQQHRTAHTRAERGLVVGGADHGGRARDACADGAPQDIIAEEPLQPVYFVVAPAGIERRFLDDVRRLVRRDVHGLQEISPAPGIDEVDYLAIDDAAAGEGASESERCGGCAGADDGGRVFGRGAEGDARGHVNHSADLPLTDIIEPDHVVRVDRNRDVLLLRGYISTWFWVARLQVWRARM